MKLLWKSPSHHNPAPVRVTLRENVAWPMHQTSTSFRLRKETGAAGGNPGRHGENMQTPHGQWPKPRMETRSLALWGAMLTTGPPCSVVQFRFHSINFRSWRSVLAREIFKLWLASTFETVWIRDCTESDKGIVWTSSLLLLSKIMRESDVSNWGSNSINLVTKLTNCHVTTGPTLTCGNGHFGDKSRGSEGLPCEPNSEDSQGWVPRKLLPEKEPDSQDRIPQEFLSKKEPERVTLLLTDHPHEVVKVNVLKFLY